jgi:Xaa-Pro dipeptidase
METAFTHEEYRRRLDTIQTVMHRLTADVMVLDDAEDLFYVTGFAPSATMYQGCLVFRSRPPVMVVRRLDYTAFAEQSWINGYVAYGDADNPIQLLAQTIASAGYAGGRVALGRQSHFMTAVMHDGVRTQLPEATLLDFGAAVRRTAASQIHRGDRVFAPSCPHRGRRDAGGDRCRS